MQLYFYLNTFIYGLVKRTFWDHVKEEASSVWESICDFFSLIKEYTYDLIADKIGSDITGIIFICVIALGIMVVLITLINK